MTLPLKVLPSTIIERAIPAHIRREHPNLVLFLKKGLEFMEEEDRPTDLLSRFSEIRDVDTAPEDYLELLRRELLQYFPSALPASATNVRTFVKNIKLFYKAKGTVDAAQFLLRALFAVELEVYEPKRDVIRASDGKWQQTKTIILGPIVTAIPSLILLKNKPLVGLTSGATAIIEYAEQFTQGADAYYRLGVTYVSGTFTDAETISISTTPVFTAPFKSTVSGTIALSNAGANYQIGDRIPIKLTGVTVGLAEVTRVAGAPITSVTVVNPGTGYLGLRRLSTVFTRKASLIPGIAKSHLSEPFNIITQLHPGAAYASNAPAAYASISSIADTIQALDQSGNGYGASLKIDAVDAFGGIQNVKVVSGGFGYTTPLLNVLSDTGTGAVLTPVAPGAGAIKQLRILTAPAWNASLTLDFTTHGDGNAAGTVSQASVCDSFISFLNQDGLISSKPKLQDNDYWQDYSYVLRSPVYPAAYMDILNKTSHPAGFKVFGETLLTRTTSLIAGAASAS